MVVERLTRLRLDEQYLLEQTFRWLSRLCSCCDWLSISSMIVIWSVTGSTQCISASMRNLSNRRTISFGTRVTANLGRSNRFSSTYGSTEMIIAKWAAEAARKRNPVVEFDRGKFVNRPTRISYSSARYFHVYCFPHAKLVSKCGIQLVPIMKEWRDNMRGRAQNSHFPRVRARQKENKNAGAFHH